MMMMMMMMKESPNEKEKKKNHVELSFRQRENTLTKLLSSEEWMIITGSSSSQIGGRIFGAELLSGEFTPVLLTQKFLARLR